MWSFQYGLKGGAHPKSVTNDSEIDGFAVNRGLRYYNSDIHKATFATPNFVKQLIKK